MNPQLLELSRAQLSLSWKRSRFNHYSDLRKQRFHDNLNSLYDKLIKLDFSDPSLNDDTIQFYRKVLDFFIESLTLLDNNTISSVPHEIIECLNIAARQWLTDFDDYIIVMQDGPYAIVSQVEEKRVFYGLIKNKLGVDFKNILLKVCMPKQLSRDYLTNVCLFHELGHFVDEKLKITDDAYEKQMFNKWNGPKRNEVNNWFKCNKDPYVVLPTPVGVQIEADLQSFFYLKEYFADLFCSQYVAENSLSYLEYITEKPDKDMAKHPSYDKRKRMCDDFIKGNNTNPVLESLCESTKLLSKDELSVKYCVVDKSDMLSFIPCEITDENQLLSIFKLGWDVFKGGSEPFEKKNNLSFPLKTDKIYECVNNLIEKTISNYLILRDWNSIKHS